MTINPNQKKPINLNREELINTFIKNDTSEKFRTFGPHSLQEEQTRELALTFLTNVSINTKESFSPKEAETLLFRFNHWKKDYLAQMEDVVSINRPTIDGNLVQLHPITSLPADWSVGKFFSTKIKEKEADPIEKQHVQENLRRIAESTFTVNNIPKNEDDAQHLQDLKLIASMSQLARGYAYHSPKTGDVISIYSDETQSLVEYTVTEIPMRFGINAFGLMPKEDSEASPILLFRGTSFYPSGRAAGSTIFTDLNPLGIGLCTYNKKSISTWIKQAAQVTGKKVVVTGHSLGSAYATYAAIDNAEDVKIAYGFGATKVSAFYKKKWDAVKDKLTILKFNAPGDKFTTWGHVDIATATYEGTMGEGLPSVEVIGKTEKQTGNWLVNFLNSLRPGSTAHRVDYFGTSVTLRRSTKKEKHRPLATACKIVGLVVLYPLAGAALLTSRGLFGSHKQKGLYDYLVDV